MKRLEDLKKELLDNEIHKFYVFYGEDYGIRKHYINKIQTNFTQKARYIDDYQKISNNASTKSLFGDNKKLVVIYNDEQFLELKKEQIVKFIKGLKQYYCIFVYEKLDENSILIKEFSDYVTYFPVVQNNIAQEFVDNEVSLNLKDSQNLAYNCANNYNNILLESDKIREYAFANKISQQCAYEVLYCKGQLIEIYDEFNANDFMNDVLTQNRQNYFYWYTIMQNDVERFIYSLTFILNDFLIAALVQQYGIWEGGSKAYNLRLPWGRTKVIRDLPIPYDVDYLLNCSYKVAEIDELIKRGKLDRNKVPSYFFYNVLANYDLDV